MQNPIKRHNIKLRHLFINGKSFCDQNTSKDMAFMGFHCDPSLKFRQTGLLALMFSTLLHALSPYSLLPMKHVPIKLFEMNVIFNIIH